MRPGASYRGARRNEARSVRKKGERIGQVMISYMDIMRLNRMAAIRRTKEAQAAA